MSPKNNIAREPVQDSQDKSEVIDIMLQSEITAIKNWIDDLRALKSTVAIYNDPKCSRERTKTLQ